VRGELFDDLFAVPQRAVAELGRRAAHMGLDLSRSHVVVVARVASPDREAAGWRAARSAHGPAGLSGQHRGSLVLLVAADDAPATARRVAADLQAAVGCPVTVGAAGPGSGPVELAELYREAGRVCDVLLSLGRGGEAAGRDELGVYGLLLSTSGQGEVERYVRRTVGPLLDYDRERGSELVRTLLAYYGAGGSLTRAAQELFVHVNTSTSDWSGSPSCSARGGGPGTARCSAPGAAVAQCADRVTACDQLTLGGRSADAGGRASTSRVIRRSTTKDSSGTVPASITSSIRRTDQPARRPRSATVSR
jgi:hypothetical protein